MATANPGNVGALISTLTFSELTDLIRREFEWDNENYQRNARQLYMEDTIPQGTGSSRRYKEVDGEKFANWMPEGVNAVKAKMAIGYEVDMIDNRRGKEVEITFLMRLEGRDRDIINQITSLSEFLPNRMEIDLTHRFTFCTSSTYTDMDGQTVDVTVGDGNPLAYSAHTLSASSTQYSNRLTGDPAFSKGSWEAALLLGATQTYTNFGELIPFQPNCIVSYNDPSTIDAINVLFHSNTDPTQNNPGVRNTYEGNAIKHVILHYLATTAVGAYDSTKRRWWAMGAVNQGSQGWQSHLGIWEANNLKTPTPGNNGEDPHNDNWTYGARGSYGIVILSGRKMLFSCPTS